MMIEGLLKSKSNRIDELHPHDTAKPAIAEFSIRAAQDSYISKPCEKYVRYLVLWSD